MRHRQTIKLAGNASPLANYAFSAAFQKFASQCHQTQMDTPQNLPSRLQRIQALEAKANQTRFRKQIDIRTFAYHA